ncbi:MAG: GNAT family N-acetyltransferase [Actinomycetaceae bacterium]
MSVPGSWPAARPLETSALVLEPLRVEHAAEMAAVLDDERLHEFTGGQPATPQQLHELYERQVVGRSAAGDQLWLNWILRRRATGEAAGYLQATVTGGEGAPEAEIAWVVGTAHQGHGFAREAAEVVLAWLFEQGAGLVVADIHPDHGASNAVAAGIGLRRTDTVIDGEVRWAVQYLASSRR